MIDHLTALDLSTLARAGGGLEVDGSRYTALDLSSVARSLQPGAILVVHNSRAFTALDLSSIARSNPGQVRFA